MVMAPLHAEDGEPTRRADLPFGRHGLALVVEDAGGVVGCVIQAGADDRALRDDGLAGHVRGQWELHDPLDHAADSLADGQFSCMSRSAATSDSVRTKTLPEDSAMSLWPTMPAKAVVTIPSPLKWRW